MIPDNLKKKHIIQAINEAKEVGIPIGRGSRKYLLKHENDYFPPKYVISLANKYANGIILDRSSFGGGNESNNFLNNLGFKIVNLSSLTNSYIKILKKQNKISSTKIHTGENCSECKRVIKKLLERIYGKIETNYKFDVGSKPEDFINNKYYEKLKEIFAFLQSSRGYKDFVKAKNLPHCDYYIPEQSIIIEFDESQHFTPLRALTLRIYPTDINIGFDKNKWIELCEKTNAKDNNPFYRDEQRAWYDTLRDLLPLLDISNGKSVKTVIRLYAKDFEWCSLNPNVPSDIRRFKDILVKYVSRYELEMIEDSDTVPARISKIDKWKGKPGNSKEILEEDYKKTISELLELHQEIKGDFIKEYGKTKISNNEFTTNWLETRDNSDIKSIRRKLNKIMKYNDDIKTNYNILRDVYIISPSLHEMWFFNDHFKKCFGNFIKHRCGLKSYLTSKERNTLNQNRQKITTYVLKNTILLENMACAELKHSLMDKQVKTSTNIVKDIESIKNFYEKGSITKESIIQMIPVIFKVTRSLLKQCKFKQLKSGILLKKWFEYAPCSINEGPIFVPKANENLVDILSSIKSLEQETIRDHLRKHYTVKEIK